MGYVQVANSNFLGVVVNRFLATLCFTVDYSQDIMEYTILNTNNYLLDSNFFSLVCVQDGIF